MSGEFVRIYHATDVHGSEQVWRKWLNVPKVHKANILLFCGDLTGKSIVPIIEQPDGTYTCSIFGKKYVLKSKEEVKEMEDKIRFSGYYPYVTTKDEVEELKANPKRVDQLFEKLMCETMERWLQMIVDLIPKDVTCVVMPGNDDEFFIDPVIQKFDKEYENIIYPLGKVVNLCYDYEMISYEWVNPTPWNSPREKNEKGISKDLEKLWNKVNVDPEKVILNFHCPPFGTRLDLAPKLDKNLRPVYVLGEQQREHVGSRAVRKFIEKYQPLLGLHGHIHESYASEKIGRTLCVNPGSEYTEGILRGFIIDLDRNGILRWWKVEG
ncbi:MAG: metallophosphoesterase family protein [Candidatus Baldrarchaeia archaeon]